MTKVSDVLKYLETVAPHSMKMEWDNVGLLCGNSDQTVNKILVALDPFEHVCREAADMGADLIVTHHPLIFVPCKSITEETSVGRSLRFLIQHDISAINAHTNLDCAPGGVNDVLASVLGLRDPQVIAPNGVDEHGREWGLLRWGTVEEQPLEQFLNTVKTQLHCEGLRYVSGGRSVRKVAVGGGACGSELMDAVDAGCDTFVTSDIKYNQFWDAHDLGLNLIDAGHFYTENPVCTYLAEQIRKAFPEIQVLISQKHKDCMKFFL